MDKKRLAVVTGAASGIGYALAQGLDQRGYRLALCDRDEDGLSELTAGLTSEACTEAFDISDRERVYAFAARTIERLGTPDLVIHNAGVSLSQNVASMQYEDLEWVMNINFWGMVYGCKAFLSSMLEHGGGTQVFVSSIFGVVGVPTQSAYNASKFAIRGFAEALREEVGDRLHVLIVCPGGVRTNIIRNGRIHDWPAITPRGSDPVKSFEKIARLQPAEAAEQILAAVDARRRRLVLGSDARMLDWLQRLFPTTYHQASRRLGRLLR